MRYLVLSGSVFPVLLAGCAAFEYQASKPLLHQEAKSKSGADIFAVGAERRIIISQEVDVQRRFCSEPPPDVAQSFADSVRAALQLAAQQQRSTNQSSDRRVEVTGPDGGASAPTGGSRNSAGSQQSGSSQSASGNANLDLARDFATSVSQIYTRSQGVQLFRDGSYMLCQAHLNGAIRGDKLEEVVRLATEYERADVQRASPESTKSRAIVPSIENINKAWRTLAAPEERNDLNYSAKFTELLNTVHSVLIQELPNLYRYDVEQAKKNAQEAAQRATTAVTQASAAAAAAGAAQTSTGQLRDQAAQSATKAAESSAAAAASSQAAKASADAAQAAASAAAGKK